MSHKPFGELFAGRDRQKVWHSVRTLRPIPKGVDMQIDDAGCYFDQAGERDAMAVQGRVAA